MRREATTADHVIEQEMSEVALVQRAVEAALVAVLEQRKRGQRKKPKPKPTSEVERQIARATANPTKSPPRDRHGFRGTPPPADFSLAALADDALLNEVETAAVLRLSVSTLSAWRGRDDPLIEWLTLGGGRYIRYRVSAVKKFLASGYRPQPGRPRKKDAAPAPKRTPAKPPARRRADNAADDRPRKSEFSELSSKPGAAP
jgi:hypothetical protein